MRVAYITIYDSRDVEAWSGLGTSIREALRHVGLEIHTIDGLSTHGSILTAFQRLYWEKVAGKRFQYEREAPVLRSYAAQISKALAATDCDVVFSPGTVSIAYLTTDRPIVFWSDSVFAGMVDFYPTFTNLSAQTIRSGHRMEQSALNRCRLAIYSSDWAASMAIRHYVVNPAKVRVVPFGANTEGLGDVNEAKRVTSSRSHDVCRLLFVGVDWIRKRGDLAVSIAECLAERGVRVELHVVGCIPARRLPDFVTVHGFLSKRTSEDRATLKRLFSESHVLLHPSSAECYGLALAEASSFALPCVTASVGGTRSVVTDGINGRLFQLNDGPHEYSTYIEALFTSREAYDTLALSSYREFSERLNWAVSARRVRELLREAIAPRESA